MKSCATGHWHRCRKQVSSDRPSETQPMKRVMFALLFLSTLALPTASVAQPRAASIPQDLLAAIARDGEASYLVVLRERPDLSASAGVSDWTERGRFVYDAL